MAVEIKPKADIGQRSARDASEEFPDATMEAIAPCLTEEPFPPIKIEIAVVFQFFWEQPPAWRPDQPSQ
jgi:hypothetical protein